MEKIFEENVKNKLKKVMTNIPEESELHSNLESNFVQKTPQKSSPKLVIDCGGTIFFSPQWEPKEGKKYSNLNLPTDSKKNSSHTLVPEQGGHGQENTPTTSNSSPNYNQVLRKFDLNPYNNFNIEKKMFLYQMKNSLLQAKKLCLSREIQKINLTNPMYYDIFSNYSNIKITENPKVEKYEDGNMLIKNYVIFKRKLLGKGGYSAVYLCQDIDTNKEYAVKVTEKNTRANKLKKKYDYVKEEVTILKRIHSKYIVEVYDILETKTEIMIVMEYMKNNSLFNAINDLTGFQIWRYFRNLICGVQHCHEIGKIVHRDINVNNLLISENDTVKLSDFGISAIIENDDLLPCNSGPSTYTPPEKIYNETQFYHGKPADMWLIGVTLYHMVFKRPLFQNFGNLTKEDYMNIKLPEDSEKIEEKIQDIILSLLSFDPGKRPTFQDLQKNKWVTHDDEFPLPDTHDEALQYCYELTSEEILGVKDEKMCN